MAFGTLLVSGVTYNSVGPGEYMNSTVGFGQPVDMIKLSPGKRANSKAPVSSAMTYVYEKDLGVGQDTQRKRMSVSMQMNIPDGMTPADLDSCIDFLSTLATPVFLTRLLLGES